MLRFPPSLQKLSHKKFPVFGTQISEFKRLLLIGSCSVLWKLSWRCYHVFDPGQLSSVCARFAEDYGAVRAGFPDLTVWNSVENKLKVIEVKGPNDKLSHKQILWIDFLLSLEIPVEICHIISSGAKRKFSNSNS